ncbi:MAG: hypothetical protein ACOYL3_25330 [Desulfuromonadaceae bacterium]
MKNNDPGLFESSEISKPPRTSETAWYFATNHMNFLRILATGLFVSPKGLGDKYFEDSLNSFPGWIPIFPGYVPKKIVEVSVSEKNYLFPCLAEIKLTTLRGQIVAIYGDGSSHAISFPEELSGTEAAILVPAPLPTSWIERIIFRSKDEKNKCDSFAKNCLNVPLDRFKRDIDAKMFLKDTTLDWPSQLTLDNRDTSPDMALAAGGMMALLYQFANMGDSATAACRLAFECGNVEPLLPVSDNFEQTFGDWLKTAEPPKDGEIAQRLFWKIVSRVVSCRSIPGIERNVKDRVLELLDREKDSMEKAMQDHLVKLIADLRSLSGLADSTMSELFKRHPKYFSRALLLFFLRENSTELIELTHADLKEADYIAAAIIFAARDGWIDLPLSLRSYSDMESAISHRMAAMAHRLSKSGLELGSAPPSCVPLREFFASGVKNWNPLQKDAALQLAREYKWDCIHTKISLGKGDYRLIVDSGTAHILIPGDVKAVITEVDALQFMINLAETKVSYDVDNKIRLKATKNVHS